MKSIIHIKTISDIHSYLNLPKPKHPLVAIYPHDNWEIKNELIGKQLALDLYQVTYKMCAEGSFGYGRNSYDFKEGTLIFMQPGQVMTMHEPQPSASKGGWTLFFHPDLIRKSELANHINNYSFFSYDVHEALHLSDDEKQTIGDIRNKIIKEYSLNLDKHSQKLIISNIELLLDYCNRFYDRQFYTRTNINKDIVTRFEELLKKYYSTKQHIELGIPSVKYCGTTLNMSPNYLSDLLKKETGRNAQEHIHFYVIEKAKTQLLNSAETIGQIAYGLGFEYPQHFSKIFKKKTGMSPAAYRNLN